MKTSLTIYKDGNNSKIDIATLLTEEDHKKWWNGIEEERQDGSDCIISDNVQKIMDVAEKHSAYTIELWETGNAMLKDLDKDKLQNIIDGLSKEFNEEFEVWED